MIGPPPPRRIRRRRGERGIALLLALLMLVILSVIIVQMTASSLHTRTVADNHVADLQNTYALRAGYHQALLFLQSDLDQGADRDSLGERWAQPLEFDLGRAHVQVLIQDSERFLSLAQVVDDKGVSNPLVAAQLRRLLRVLRHPPEMADRILDYIDGDSKGAFEARAKNDRLYNPEELLRIEGVTPEVVYGGQVGGEERKGLAAFVTTWPMTPAAGAAPGAVNINTASVEVLQSLADEVTPVAAAAIVAGRSIPGPDGRMLGYKSVEDVKKTPGMSGAVFDAVSAQLTVKSSTFEIRVRSRIGTLEKSWIYVVQRGGGTTGGGITLLSSQRLNDFLTIRPPEERK